jgi:transcriptional regulator with XRE-family HTH domain
LRTIRGEHIGAAVVPQPSQRYRIDETDIALGARIRVRRNELKLTQEMLAEALGVTYQQVQKYERGIDRISVSMLIKIARRLDCTVAALIGEQPGSIDDTLAPRLAIPGARELLEIYARIGSATTRRRLLDLLSDLAADQPPVEDKTPKPAPWRRGIKRNNTAAAKPRSRRTRPSA